MSIVEYKNYTSEIIQLIVTKYFLTNTFIATIKFIFDIFVSLKSYIYTGKLKLNRI